MGGVKWVKVRLVAFSEGGVGQDFLPGGDVGCVGQLAQLFHPPNN